MSQPGTELFFAVRPKLIGYYLGQFCLIMAGINLVPLTVALFSAPWRISASYAVIFATLFIIWALLRHMRSPGAMQNERSHGSYRAGVSYYRPAHDHSLDDQRHCVY
ncbi:MAG: hypothetical protein RBR22_04585 [Desulfuromonas sp.]|nr:hypothetical protein [Desulfuromonas sp.]